MSAISNLSNISSISRLGSVRRPNKKAYLFDGVNDYIAGDTTIGRTGYDMNTGGNFQVGSDSDGSYIQMNGNRDATAATGTRCDFGNITTPSYTQANSFSIKVRVKFIAFAANNVGGIFGSTNDAALHIESGTSKCRFTVRGSTNVNFDSGVLSLNTLYDLHLVYDASTTKFYCYVNGTLQNAGGTTGPATFTTNSRYLGDNAIGAGNATSNNMYIYHAAIRNVALTQAEVDADIALGNTAKTDSRIVAYYIPGNLQYNTQYVASPKNLTGYTKGSGTTVTGDYSVAPDGTTTADRVVRTGVDLATSTCYCPPITTLTGSTLSSKTFIVKAFVKVAAGTALFRLRLAHRGVADYYSSNQTATTTRQEFTFTQTFTSSTSGTGIDGGVSVETGFSAADLEVRNVRVFLTNETLRDESPNIGGYIGWKTPLVMSTWIRPDIDSADTTTKQVFFQAPWHYMQLRTTTNNTQRRSETTLRARTAATYIPGSGFRSKVHFLGYKVRDGTGRLYKSYVNGALVAGSQTAYTDTVRPAGTIYRTNASLGFYSTDYRDGNIRDARIYTFTGSFTDADALRIYQGLEPSSAGITKYLHWRPTPGETGTTAIDHSGNSRTGTLTGGVTRPFLSGS